MAKTYQQKLTGNIWKYTVMMIANKRVFAAILGAYYLTIPGVTEQTIGFILLAGSVAGFVFEIPSGYLSDKIGHKYALVISRISMLVSSLFLLFAESTWMLVLGGIFMSIGQAFMSGTGSAFMHETLKALGREDDYTRVMGKVSSIGFAVPIVFTVLVPFLVEISFRAPFVFSLVVDLIGLLAALALMAPQVSAEHVKEIGVTNFRQVITAGHQLHFFGYASFTAIIGGVLFGIGGFRAPYQVFLEVPVIYFGVLFGAGRALASLLLAYSGRLRDRFASKMDFFRFQLILYGVLLLALGLFTNVWVVLILFIIINGFQWGLSQIERGFLLDIIKESNFKATLLSVKSQLYLILQGVTAALLGVLIGAFGYQVGFLAVALITILVLIPLYAHLRRKG